jgi:hypothetical protein
MAASFNKLCSQYLHKYFSVECCSLPCLPVVWVLLANPVLFGVRKYACVECEFGHQACMSHVFCRVTKS